MQTGDWFDESSSAMFTIAGVPKIGRKDVRFVTWDRGRLSGDRLLVELASDNARALEGRAVGFPGGPQSSRNHLANPHAMAWIIGELFEPGTIRVTGKLAKWPKLPPGAISGLPSGLS
jgi:hypothetical protein